MKRYCEDVSERGYTEVREGVDGEYVLFADHQAALKELATKSLSFGHCHRFDCGVNVHPIGKSVEVYFEDESKCTCGLREFRAHLKALTERA